ncbi:hypothetical protein [Lewinella sp. 4G2]|uniref:hypothetical protein n=1 Tax=Lewinella sp. 4G2 TaxID=1803372 RepID=UPI0012FBBD23|nr:hypothetical protein [Lewinella sp. 4G2]
MKVNVHFFVNDDGTGLTAGNGASNQLEQRDVFQKADDLVYFANQYMEDISSNKQLNQIPWGADTTSAQCVGLRFLLDEVFIHRDSNMDLINIGGHNDQYVGINYRDAYNILAVDIRRASGYAPRQGRYMVVRSFDQQLIVHEFGHSLLLEHTHFGNSNGDDNCFDTPWYKWEYDRYGDGSVIDSKKTCWNVSNRDASGTDLCTPNGTTVINPHPCCDSSTVNNNVMTYSAAAQSGSIAALTPCQVDIAMTELLKEKCDLIAAIEPICKPVSAHIGYKPNTDFSQDCSWTFYLRGSTNETEHRISYQKLQPDGTYSPFLDSDWLPGRAREERVVVGDDPYIKHGTVRLPSNSTYIMTLTTRNNCDTDHYRVEFTTGACDVGDQDDSPNPGPFHTEEFQAYPNPSNGPITLEYGIASSAEIEIYVGSNATNSFELIADISGYKLAGSYHHQLDLSFLPNGAGTIVVVVDGYPFYKQFVKQ